VRVDFYQLSRDTAETALPLLARAALGAGQRLVVVSADEAQLARIDKALWERLPESFLAHDFAGGPHDARQPVLLSEAPEPANGAKLLAIADGKWRDVKAFERVLYLFDEATVASARRCWVELGNRDGIDRRFWKQDGGKWQEGP
jgi:DNA polymerase III subunit chi